MFRRGATSSLVPLCGSRAASISLLPSYRANEYVFRSYAQKSEAELQQEKEKLERAKQARITKGLLELTLAAPHDTIHNARSVKMVTIPARSGRMGVLAKHIPTVTPLSPGLVTVKPEEGKDEHYFISGGFATISADSECSINAPEVFPLDQLSLEAAKRGLEEYSKRAANAAESKHNKAIAEVAVSVYKEIIAAVELAGKGQ